MKIILFLNPSSLEGFTYMKELGRCGRKSFANEVWPQTGLAHLAAVVEKTNDVKIIDAMAEGLDFKETLVKIKEFNPCLIIISTTTPTFENDAKVCNLIKKELDTKIGFVGTHVSTLPKECLGNSDADFILVNEGEYTLKELVEDKPWKGIKGLCYKKDDKIFCNKLREPIEDLDELPLPARHLLPNEKYTMPLTNNKPFATIISSRGCPYKCIFCRAGSVWGKGVRKRSVNNVIKEIRYIIYSIKINHIVFMTDTFTINKQWTIELCKQIVNQNIKFKWLCNSRVDTIDKEMLSWMKKAGCISISYGIESGNEEILEISGKNITLDKSRRAIKLTRKAGIDSFAYFILGLPGETKQTVNQTIEFAKQLSPDYAIFHIATPFPGTELYDIAYRNNWLISNRWSDFEEQGGCVIRTKDLTAEDLIKAQKYAMRTFYFRPKQLFREIKKLKNIDSLKTKVMAGIDLIRGF